MEVKRRNLYFISLNINNKGLSNRDDTFVIILIERILINKERHLIMNSFTLAQRLKIV